VTDQNHPSSDLPPQQPQQSFGDAPQPPPPPLPPAAPGASFGSAPQPADAFGTPPPPPVEQPKKKGGLAKILGGAAAVIVAICVAAGIFAVKNYLNEDATKEAQTGNCIANLPDVAEGEEKEAPNAEVVDCTDAKAAYKVEGRVDNVTESQAGAADVCKAYEAAVATYTAIDPNKKSGYVLCLSEVTK
jgi:uncharacterized protein HemX